MIRAGIERIVLPPPRLENRPLLVERILPLPTLSGTAFRVPGRQRIDRRAGLDQALAVSLPSAGLLLYRRSRAGVEVLLVHPGGPFFRNRDDGWWTVPKGWTESGEEPLDAARREFAEETGLAAPDGPFVDLGSVRQKSGKVVHAWAVEGDCDPAGLFSNTFQLEWPPRSGRTAEFPEVDRAAFFTIEEARRKILAAQAPFLDRLAERLESG
jgi:predicted NUDIX family NTP pyrophosphohydrolase